ncbi:MAG: hypothetical protein CVT49_05165 [candidate division Zixibacteria bacterium HGW-Zixibacteria-1]|nr:MAG: hypothetical protein CVT49_05165 [candidate division Zixibacteria bacterium HGW-Zixibacteria-1]
MEENNIDNKVASSAKGRMAVFFRKAPVLTYTVFFLVIAELIMIFVAPAVVPDTAYMSLYLTDFAKENTTEYIQNTDKYNIRDTLVGWRNRPGCVYEKWYTDNLGARSTHEFDMAPKKAHRVMFLGSSLINGGPFVYIDETISALIEDSLIESVNFGVMRYSVDQVYLAYSAGLNRYGADVIIVELNAAPCEGLRNQYIPFRDRFATDMPYLKPRFMLKSGTLEYVPMPPEELLDSVFKSPNLVEWLKNTDDYYSNYEDFKRYGQMPLSSGFWHILKKAGNLYRILFGDPEGEMILEKLMQRLVDEAGRQGASVIFLSLPDLNLTVPARWRKFLPDRYKIRLEHLRSKGFDIIDAREIFRKSGKYPRRLFVRDNRHLTPLGNRLVAEELKNHLEKQWNYTDLPDQLK